MLLKRALFLVSAENEVEPLVEFAKVFKKRYNVKVDAIYVKDILKYDVFPVTVEGIGINLGTNFAYKEFRDIENKTFEKIKEPLEKEFHCRLTPYPWHLYYDPLQKLPFQVLPDSLSSENNQVLYDCLNKSELSFIFPPCIVKNLFPYFKHGIILY